MVANPVCKAASGCGPWKAPMIKNPEFKGPWEAPLIDNPAYKGVWTARMVSNPHYFKSEVRRLALAGSTALLGFCSVKSLVYVRSSMNDKTLVLTINK